MVRMVFHQATAGHRPLWGDLVAAGQCGCPTAVNRQRSLRPIWHVLLR